MRDDDPRRRERRGPDADDAALTASSPLWATPNLIMSPHCAVDDATAYAERALALFLGNLKRYVGGRALMNIVDTRLGY